jgi:membrane-anchored glycerophosphoryl diester phosphodiesterase (GDPDase)
VSAGLVVGFWMGVTGTVAAFVWFVLLLITTLVISVLGFGLGLPEWAVGVMALGFTLLAALAALAVFFYLGGLLAYVLQAMMVEGRGVFEAVNRSTKLARGHSRRLATVFFFTTFVSFSAWMLLVTPLIYIGVAEGYSLNPWSASEAPVWYRVGFQVMWQASSILLAPIWMLGLSLLYIDERVRQEGYDIELAAERVFGTMPDVPHGYVAPLSPALAGFTRRAPRTRS